MSASDCIPAEAVHAFRQMVRHQLELWDAADDLERILKCEVSSNDIQSLAACFGEPATADKLTSEDLRKWLAVYAVARPDEACL